MTDPQSKEIRRLLNQLNLGTGSVRLGDVLLDHIAGLEKRIEELEANTSEPSA